MKPRISIFVFLLLLITAAAIYGLTLGHTFNLDDRTIYDRTELLEWRNASQLLRVEPRRFVAYFTFLLNYQVHGLNVSGYHAVNIALHVVNAFLVFCLLQQLLSFASGNRDGPPLWPATFGALIFLVHPLQTGAVTYIVQRLTLLATASYLTAFLLYIRARQHYVSGRRREAAGWFGLSGLILLIGLFSKEIVFTLPLMIILYELLMCERPLWRLVRIPGILYFFAVILASIFVFQISTIQVFRTIGSPNGEMITPGKYLLTQFRVFWHYLALLAWPVGQNVDHDIRLSHHLLEPVTLAAFLGLMAALTAGWRYGRKRPLFLFGLCWFFGVQLLESSIIPLNDVMFEHRLYLPMAGVVMMIGYWGQEVWRSPQRRGVVAVVSVGAIVILALLSYQRNLVWASKTTLWTDAVEKSPKKARPYYNLGNAYLAEEDYEKAIALYSQSIGLYDRFPGAYMNRAKAYRHIGEDDLAAQDLEALARIHGADLPRSGARMSLRSSAPYAGREIPRTVDEMVQYANMLLNGNDIEGAGKWYREVLGQNPEAADVWNNLGYVEMKKGGWPTAEKYYTRAIELDPDLVQPWFNRGFVRQMQRDFTAAIDDYDRAIALDPEYTEAYNDRGLAYFQTERYEEAVADFEQALAVDPDFEPARVNRAKARGAMIVQNRGVR